MAISSFLDTSFVFPSEGYLRDSHDRDYWPSRTGNETLEEHSDPRQNFARRLICAMNKLALQAILPVIPDEWLGTTYRNSNLIGRVAFIEALEILVRTKGTRLTSSDLLSLGNAEDYFRVSNNLSTILEAALAFQKGFSVHQTFSFSSKVFPIISVVLLSQSTVELFVGPKGVSPFTPSELKVFNLFNSQLVIKKQCPIESSTNIVLCIDGVFCNQNIVDAFIRDHFLFIQNVDRINPDDVYLFRKRLNTPLPSPQTLEIIHSLAELPFFRIPSCTEKEINRFYSHLQQLCGTPIDFKSNPLIFSSGLSSLSSIWLSLIKKGGAHVLMASTAYGGSSQLIDILCSRTNLLKKHTFDITGSKDMNISIQNAFSRLNCSFDIQYTVLFLEMPTNPDMKVCNINQVISELTQHRTKTKQNIILVIDTSFSPGCKILSKINSSLISNDFPIIVIISLSKSVSCGRTTAGALIAYHSNQSYDFLSHIKEDSEMFNLFATDDQWNLLVKHHEGVEIRNQKAYFHAKTALETLRQTVQSFYPDIIMNTSFVTEEQAEEGFITGTFSFNLPAFPNGTELENKELAQRFVNLVTEYPEFKPCVSFGQLSQVYATVPATSTQGAIDSSEKEKQEIDGVQLVRLSFPSEGDVDRTCEIIKTTIERIYQ